MYKDGGSIKYDMGSYSVLIYNTLDGEKALVIGTDEMNIDRIKKGLE